MVFTTLYKLVAKSFLAGFVTLTVMNFLPDTLFEKFPLEPRARAPIDFPSEIEGWNTKLSDTPEYIQLNNLMGAESLAFDNNGLLYTGLVDGRIVEIDTKKKDYPMRQVTRMTSAKLCEKVLNTAEFMPQCGRPLQVRYLNGTLFVADSYKGLYSINPKTGTKKHLMANLNKNFHGLFNSFVFDPVDPNIVYVTVSSRKWALEAIIWSMFDLDTTGIVFGYDLTTGKSVILADNLALVNGIAVDVKRDQLLFTETSYHRIHKMPVTKARSAFKSAKSGDTNIVQTDFLIPQLPGVPDNVHVEGDEAYIAMPLVKTSGKELQDHLAEMPIIKKALGRLAYSVGYLLEYVHNNFYTHPILETAIFEIKSGHIVYRSCKQHSGVLRYNLNTGSSSILGSDKFAFISEAIPDKQGNLYLASFRNTFIVKVRV